MGSEKNADSARPKAQNNSGVACKYDFIALNEGTPAGCFNMHRILQHVTAHMTGIPTKCTIFGKKKSSRW